MKDPINSEFTFSECPVCGEIHRAKSDISDANYIKQFHPKARWCVMCEDYTEQFIERDVCNGCWSPTMSVEDYLALLT